MAKAAFHKHQRVYVEPVGTWAVVEQIKPHWVKGVEEPVRIAYDVGLGRDFTANELIADKQGEHLEPSGSSPETENWRVIRGVNRWQTAEECPGHPFPGTYPIVVTDAKDWGGWRVPGGEYDRDPIRIEFQARAIASTLRLVQLADMLATFAKRDGFDLPHDLVAAATEARDILRYIRDEANLPSPEDAEAA